MARIRATGTKPELAMRAALCRRGLHGYRLHRRDLPGVPDVAWIGLRVAVFVDGAFWHGHPSAYTPGKSGAYWDQKIARNVARDRAADQALRERGWTVLRFWDFDVMRDVEPCVSRIETALCERRALAHRTGQVGPSGGHGTILAV